MGEGVAVGSLGEGEGEGEGVGGVGFRSFGEVEHALDHAGDGGFLGGAVADDGLFHFARGDLDNFEAGFGGGDEGGAAGLAHDEGGLQIARVEEAFDNAERWLVLGDDVAEGLMDFDEAARMFPGGRNADGAVGEGC